MHEEVILVDENDAAFGTAEKMEAHRAGLRHRAFSVFVLNTSGEMLLQQRAFSKYHSGGLWSNTCCSHPRPGETVEAAAHRRLVEEMGFDGPLQRLFGFVYRAELDHDLIEHEYDHVLVGVFDPDPVPNPDEVEAYRWMPILDIVKALETQPETFSYWFRIAFRWLLAYLSRAFAVGECFQDLRTVIALAETQQDELRLSATYAQCPLPLETAMA